MTKMEKNAFKLLMAISCSSMKPIVFFDKANALKTMALLLLPVFVINNNLLGNPIN